MSVSVVDAKVASKPAGVWGRSGKVKLSPEATVHPAIYNGINDELPENDGAGAVEQYSMFTEQFYRLGQGG